jgi:DNA ligase-1
LLDRGFRQPLASADAGAAQIDDPMTLLSDLVTTSERVGQTSSRRTKTAEIAALLRRLEPSEVDIGVAYLAGLTPQGRSGIGYALIQAARAAPAAEPTLHLVAVDRALADIAATTGPGSVAQRTRLLAALFTSATEREQDFLTRLLLGELRQGALEGLMLDAVAQAARLPVAEVRRAAMVAGGVAAIAAPALTRGAEALRAVAIQLFRPLAPMLAQPAEDIDEALRLIPAASVEWKIDGARVQVHKSGADVRAFSRTGNDVSAAVIEIIEAVRALDAEALILDGEAIALKADGTPYPFQDTIRRFSRVVDVERMRASMPLSAFFFDCLRLNADDLIARPAHERFALLERVVPPSMVIPRIETTDPAAARAFYDSAVQKLHEGVMVKALEAAYEPGARSAAWLKVKREHTLDLVVIAAEWGHGRRSGWLSNLHLAARDPGGGFVMLGKTFKGMTDALLEWQTKELLERAITRDDWVVHVRPELVVEITFNDLQASPRYPGGLALRFARVKRYRPDKAAEQADTVDTVRAIYAAQAALHPERSKDRNR